MAVITVPPCVVAVILVFVTAAAARVTAGALPRPEYSAPGVGHVTPTAVRLPDGRTFSLVAEDAGLGGRDRWRTRRRDNGGGGDSPPPPLAVVRVHTLDGSVTVVEPGRVWHVRRDGSTAWFNVTSATLTGISDNAIPAAAGNDDVVVCAVLPEIASEVVGAIGLATAAAHVDELLSQTAAVFEVNGAAVTVRRVAGAVPESTLASTYTTASATLSAFKTQSVDGNPACARYLFAQRIVTGDGADSGTRVLGNAYVNAGCSREWGFGCVYNALDTLLALAVLTHELGHTMGAGHDTSSVSNVMYPSLGGSTELVFTATSLTQLATWAGAAVCPANTSLAPTAPPTGDDSPPVGLIVGASVGGVVGAVLVASGIVWLTSSSRQRRKSTQ